MNPDDVVRCEIHPTIGIARVGDSPTAFFVGPERPGVPPQPDGGFKDAAGRVKRQAARFRVYGYDADGNVLGELTAETAEISWTVELANAKAEWFRFLGRYQEPPADEPRLRRNQHIPVDDPRARAELVIKPGPRTVTGPGQDGSGARFDTGTFLGIPVPLGELRTDDRGRLLVLGGFGRSGASEPERAITHYANNDYWYDDVSDGPVTATVTLRGADGPRRLDARSAWVIVGPPDFSPHTTNLVTLWDVIAEAQGLEPHGPGDEVSFTRHVHPILSRLSDHQWVNAAALRGHGTGEAGDFTAPRLLARLASADPAHRELRRAVFRRLRGPGQSVAEATSEFMPQLAGDDGDPVDGRPRRWMALPPGRYERMRRWAEGEFTADWPGTAPAPGEPAPAEEPRALLRAALEACSGGPFYPGIETTYVVQRPESFDGPFHLGPGFAAGDLTKYMAVPWQADFYECHTHWWPAQRPDDVYPESHFLALLQGAGDSPPGATAPLSYRQPWARGVGEQVVHKPRLPRGAGESDTAYEQRMAEEWRRVREHAGDNDMVRQWSRLGFVVPRRAPDGGRVLVETERAAHVGLSDREWFYTLQHPDRFPEQVAASREYVRKVLADAVAVQHSPRTPLTQRPFRYTRENLEERLDLIYTRLAQKADAYDPRRERFSPTRASIVERLRQMAPFNLLDGVWLRHITEARPIDDIHALLFTIWKEEVGDGNPALNHSALYQGLLHQLGVFLPPVDSHAFARRPELLDSAFTVPAFALAISLHPEEFFPELLGMTLWLEWEVLDVVPTAELLDHHGIDSRFFRMHIGIDNAAHGHGALARDAIVLHLDEQHASGGDEAVQRQWQRVWNGYIAFQTTGNLGEDLFTLLHRPPEVEQRLIEMIKAKAPWAARNHERKRLGGSYLNDWFADPKGLLTALGGSEWVTPGDAGRSRLFELFAWNGPMYRVFTEAETALWREWIDSLARERPVPRSLSPLESMVALTDVLRARPDGLSANGNTMVGPQPGNPGHLVERPAAWWSLQPTEVLLAAVAHPANRGGSEAAGGGTARTARRTEFLRELFGPVDQAGLAAELPVDSSPAEIVDAWVEAGCPLPDAQPPEVRVSLSTPQPVSEPDSPLRLRVHGMGGVH
ncbi:LodA/GoxA family CTQ-dependent oxidase [Streptomyces sp. SAJ15]|uniref:LodA/GoxA family CTQ-dependent oxidase n=1 Tax=Streptomyces sp. SAJ15 TaxID=2011095 RepID=UPI0011856B08|nr:LodA/GoxA family CTQ-dependent oxidase [Streptomyces sp. SAJ15]